MSSTGRFERQRGQPKETPDARRKRREDLIHKEHDLREELPDVPESIDETGEVKEYRETFRKSENFEVLTRNLEMLSNTRENPRLANFENWLTTDSKQLAYIFESCAFFPRGKGYAVFLEGLRLGPLPKNSIEKAAFEKSRAMLIEIIAILRDFFEKKRKGQEDIEKRREEPILGDFIGNGIKTLSKSWNHANGLRKLGILGGLGVGIWLLVKIGQQRVWGTSKLKWGYIFGGIAAFLGINFVAQNADAKGRGLFQQFGLFRTVDKLQQDSELAKFAKDNKLEGSEENVRSLLRLNSIPLEKLYRLYKEAASYTVTKKEIDPEKLGFYGGEVDGKAVYEVIEALIRTTAINEEMRRRKEQAAVQPGKKYAAPSSDVITLWTRPGNAMKAFEAKYINGPLSATRPTFYDAIMYEYYGRDSEQQKATAAADKKETGVEKVKRGSREALEAIPLHFEEDWLERVLPSTFGMNVTKHERATILAFPGLVFSRKGEKNISIEGIEFDIDKKEQGNKDNAVRLKEKITDRVRKLLEEHAKKAPEFSGKTPEWDERTGRWMVRGITKAGVTKDFIILVNPDQKGIKLEEKGEELADYMPYLEQWHIYRGTKGALSTFWQSTFVAFGGYAKSRFKKYVPYLTKYPREAWAGLQQRDFNRILPEQFSSRITKPSEFSTKGTVTLFGIPNIEFYKYAGKETKDGKDIIKIFDIEFAVQDGLDGNKDKIAKLEAALKKIVVDAIGAKNIDILKGKTPQWNELYGKWVFEGIEVTGALISAGPSVERVLVSIDADKKPHFFIRGKEISDFGQLETVYRDAIIQRKIWDLDERLKGLPVTVRKVADDGTIEGDIAGLTFKTKAIDSSFLNLKITEQNNGRKFLEQTSAQIFESPEFAQAFLKLESLMDNASEGVWARMKELFPTSRFWVIPTSLNIPAVLNGKILQRQWKFTLDFKKGEALDNFQHALQDEPLSKLSEAYTLHIQDTIKHAEQLSREIEAASDEQKANNFAEFLSGGGAIPGLESLNYANRDYMKLFDEYRKMITDPQFNYAGLETLSDAGINIGAADWGAADGTFEIYQVLLRVWSHHTRPFAHKKENLSAQEKEAIELGLIQKVRNILAAKMQAGGGKIALNNLPPHKTEEDLEKWLNPNYAAKTAEDLKWGESAALAQWRKEKGKETVHRARERRDMSSPINPDALIGLPGDDGSKPEHGIIPKLKYIQNEVLPGRLASKFSGSVTDNYKNILRDIAEASALQAITENASEDELLNRFRTEMEKMRDKLEYTNLPDEALNLLKSFYGLVAGSSDWNLQGENPYIQESRPIKPKHKTALHNELMKLEKYYRDRLEKEHGHWYGDAYNGDRVKFAEEIEIPFYREMLLNRAILEKHNVDTLAADYSEQLKALFRNCIKDHEKLTQQQTADALEVSGRITAHGWKNTVDAMKGHISA